MLLTASLNDVKTVFTQNLENRRFNGCSIFQVNILAILKATELKAENVEKGTEVSLYVDSRALNGYFVKSRLLVRDFRRAIRLLMN